ncbi:hypothetical protein DFH27DRAFT_166506 [Peziza echinospora]|nr:hypothetical protein DFH27DRAFT_166506 [Peziza echinospora]
MPSPLVTATIQASVLSLISNVLAQTIKSYREGTPFTLDPSPLLTFTLFAILSTPPNYLWQELLESWFPSHHPTPATPTEGTTSISTSTSAHAEKPIKTTTNQTTVTATNPEKTDSTTTTKPKKLAKLNTAKKFIVDQLLSGPINNFLFLAFLKYAAAFTAAREYGRKSTTVGGGSVDGYQVLREAARDFPALHIASLKLWPMVALLSFTLIPMEKRVLFGSLVALGWNIYLGLVMG